MNYYFDTSALCRYYHRETGSEKVEEIMDAAGAGCILSHLTILETHSAFAGKARTKSISAASLKKLRTKFKTDLSQRRFEIVRVLRRHYDAAAILIEAHGLKQRLRSLDSLHLAIAIDLDGLHEIDAFVTADLHLSTAAVAEGLRVINPLVP